MNYIENYIELINRFWNCSIERAFNPSDCMLYFYLLNTCNALRWKQPFGQSDRYLSLRLGISVPTIREAKNRLKQRGVIDFKSPEKASKSIEGQTKYWFPTVQINCTDTLTDGCTDTLTNNKLNINKTKPLKKIDKKKVEDVFEEFRKSYPGTKQGFKTEFENFCKKHSDYQDAVFLLKPALERLIIWRNSKRQAGQFVPEHAHLKTWINQRRWEVEFENLEKGCNNEQRNQNSRPTSDELDAAIEIGLGLAEAAKNK